MAKFLLLFFWPLMSCCSDKNDSTMSDFKGDEIFKASTPANRQLKEFLGIPVLDSIDFIRWKLSFKDSLYLLNCHYGIGKPNTKDFINGGHKKDLTGTWQKRKGERLLLNGNKQLKLAELNNDILHLIDVSEKLMIGNGGWSYTLNKDNPKQKSDILVRQSSNTLKDSTAYEGRTPSVIPGLPNESMYNRLKWDIVLYANGRTNTPTTYLAISAPWRDRGGKKGSWKILTDTQGRITYQLLNDDGTVFISLFKPDDNILLFTDREGKLLVGNEDFSYTLNKYF